VPTEIFFQVIFSSKSTYIPQEKPLIQQESVSMEYVHYKVSKSQNIPCTHDTRQSTAFIKSIIHKSSPSSIYAKLNPIFVQLISIIWHQQFMPYSRIPGPKCNCAAKQKLQLGNSKQCLLNKLKDCYINLIFTR